MVLPFRQFLYKLICSNFLDFETLPFLVFSFFTTITTIKFSLSDNSSSYHNRNFRLSLIRFFIGGNKNFDLHDSMAIPYIFFLIFPRTRSPSCGIISHWMLLI